MTGAAVNQFEGKPSWKALVRHTVHLGVCPRLPFGKEFILTSLESLGCITIIAGNGTKDAGVLR